MTQTVAESLIGVLSGLDSKYLFGISGGAIHEIFHHASMGNLLTPIVSKHEEGAAYMADGFARISGKPGICATTTGPGALNALPGIAGAYADGVPVIALTGQVPYRSFSKGGAQESTPFGVDINYLYENVTKFNAMIYNRQVVSSFLWQALRACQQPRRGPIHLNIPVDIQRESIDFSTEFSTIASIEGGSSHLTDGIADIVEEVCRSTRVVILAGNGVREAGAEADLEKVANLLKIPVMTTPKAKGVLDERHSLSLGVCGYAGHLQAEEYLNQGIDVLIAVGTSFNEYVTNGWSLKFEPKRLFLQVDIDNRQIGKIYRTARGLNCDAKVFLRYLLNAVNCNSTFSDNIVKQREDYVQQLKAKTPRFYNEHHLYNSSSPIHPARAVADMQASFPEDSIIFIDAGNTRAWMIHYFEVPKTGIFVNAMGMAAMGYAVAACIGGKLAEPQRPVFCVTGDGSFMMNGNEIATAVNYDIPVIWVVLNDAQLGMVYHGVQSLGYPASCCQYPMIDFAKFARSLGADGYTVKEAGELNPDFVRKIIDRNRPAVINLLIDPLIPPPIQSRIKALKAGMRNDA